MATILEGSVRRSEGRVRIVGQLIDAQSDKHLWAETYDRDLKDIFEVQSDVARQIAVALEAEFSPEEWERIERKPTGDPIAYDYYSKGREYFLRYTKEDNERAIGLYQKALEIDPHYALAYTGIANAYNSRCLRFGFVPAWVDSAIAVAEKALSMDPDMAEAHLAVGNAYWGKGWFPKALERYHRAVEINPNYAVAVNNIGLVHSILGDNVEAFRWFKRSLALSPTSFQTQINIAMIYLDIGDYAKAERWLHRTLEIAPDYSLAEFTLIELKVRQTKDPQAIEQFEKALSRYPHDVDGLQGAGLSALYLGRDAQAREYFEKLAELAPGSHFDRYANIRLGYLLWKAGETDEARKGLSVSLASLEDELGQGSTAPLVLYDVAVIHAVQGEKKEACEWLQKAIDAGYMAIPWPPAMDPLFDDLRDDACFKKMMAQLRTKADKIRKEIEAME